MCQFQTRSRWYKQMQLSSRRNKLTQSFSIIIAYPLCILNNKSSLLQFNQRTGMWLVTNFTKCFINLAIVKVERHRNSPPLLVKYYLFLSKQTTYFPLTWRETFHRKLFDINSWWTTEYGTERTYINKKEIH